MCANDARMFVCIRCAWTCTDASESENGEKGQRKRMGDKEKKKDGSREQEKTNREKQKEENNNTRKQETTSAG